MGPLGLRGRLSLLVVPHHNHLLTPRHQLQSLKCQNDQRLPFAIRESENKTGTAQVGAVSKAQQIVKFGKKIDNAIREMKTLYPNSGYVTSEL